MEHKQRTLILTVGLMFGMLLGALDQTIASTAMPTIIGELGGLSRMTWVTTAYMLASTAVVPIVGKLADEYGRRPWYLLGMVTFIVGSALCGTAQTMTQLIIFRGVQGLGGGMLMPMAQTIVGDLYPGAARAKMQGVFGAIFGIASILGPKVGGWIVDSWNWRWVFYINLPFGVIAAIIIALALKESPNRTAHKIDFLGSLTQAAGTSAILLGLVEGGKSYAWTSWQILSLLIGGAALWVIFLIIESRAAEPILKLDLFKNRVFAVANGVGFLMGLGMFGALIFIPLFMQGVVGISASDAGSVMTPMMLGMIVSSVLGGRLLLRIGYRNQLVLGMGIMSAGFYLMSTMGVDITQLLATEYMVVTGLGMGLVMPTITIAVQNAFPAEFRGVVTSATAFFRSIGSTLGVTILGVVMNNRASTLLDDKLTPLFAKLPPAAAPSLAPFKQLMANDPQSLFTVLLRPEALNAIPEVIRTQLVRLLKESLAESLHTVFLVGLGLVSLGIIVALFMGNARLEYQKSAKEGNLQDDRTENENTIESIRIKTEQVLTLAQSLAEDYSKLTSKLKTLERDAELYRDFQSRIVSTQDVPGEYQMMLVKKVTPADKVSQESRKPIIEDGHEADRSGRGLEMSGREPVLGYANQDTE